LEGDLENRLAAVHVVHQGFGHSEIKWELYEPKVMVRAGDLTRDLWEGAQRKGTGAITISRRGAVVPDKTIRHRPLQSREFY
jgi:hypothetical protein